MIDASKGFTKDGPKNRLRPRDMHKIVDAYVKQAEIAGYSKFVLNEEIANARNSYNLNIPRYIDSSGVEDIQDLQAHLQGGIPNRDLDALQPYWDAFPSLRSTLFRPLRDGYSELRIAPADIAVEVTGSSEYQIFTKGTAAAVAEWWAGSRDALESITSTTLPNDLIFGISEHLLEAFRGRPLLDEYGVYEQLMSYWNDSMHDDVALIVAEGWEAASRPRPARTWKDKNGKTKYEDANLIFGTGAKAQRWVTDLIPPELIVARYFASEKFNLDALAASHEAATLAVAEFVEEHAVEEGLLWDATDDEGKVSAAMAKSRLKEARAEGAEGEEIDALTQVIAYYAEEAAAKRQLKEAALKLDQATLAQYGKLTRDDVQSLVVDDKWGVSINEGVQAEVAKLGESLVARLSLLGDRYAVTVLALGREAEELSARVLAHLADMRAKP
jgi:type I restriction enzyme M protein